MFTSAGAAPRLLEDLDPALSMASLAVRSPPQESDGRGDNTENQSHPGPPCPTAGRERLPRGCCHLVPQSSLVTPLVQSMPFYELPYVLPIIPAQSQPVTHLVCCLQSENPTNLKSGKTVLAPPCLTVCPCPLCGSTQSSSSPQGSIIISPFKCGRLSLHAYCLRLQFKNRRIRTLHNG